MANSYTLFSFSVADVTDEERDWLRTELFEDHQDLDDEALEAFREKWGVDDEFDVSGVDHAFENGHLYLFSEDGGNPDIAANLIQRFLTRFRPDSAVGFEVAYTCDRPRPGEFGGAAYWVTARDVEVFSTMEWLMGKEKHVQQT